MDNASPFQAAWQWRKFATCHLLALLLLILWLWGPTRELMNGFDFWLFDKLNGSLALNETWLKLWGLLSTRPFDAVVGVILLCLLIRGDWLLPANQVRRLTFGFIVTLLILVVIRVLYAKIAHHLHWQHASLSMLMDKAIHLSDHFPDWERVWEIKDRSKRSFPGDHASVLLVWALFMSLFARRAGQFLLIWALAVLFMLPRLVAGAHWGQDDYIGGLQMALLALAWGCYTPLAAKASGWLVQVTEPLFRLLAKLPLIGRLGVSPAGDRRFSVLAAAQLVDLPPLLLARPPLGLYAQRPGLAHGRRALAAFHAVRGFLVESLGLRRATTDYGKRANRHGSLVEARTNGQFLPYPGFLARLAPLAPAMHLAALYRGLGQRPGLEEARRPEPLVQAHLVVVFLAHWHFPYPFRRCLATVIDSR